MGTRSGKRRFTPESNVRNLQIRRFSTYQNLVTKLKIIFLICRYLYYGQEADAMQRKSPMELITKCERLALAKSQNSAMTGK